MSVDFLPKNFPPFQVHHAKKPPRFYPDGFQRNVIDFYLFFRIVGSEKPYICSFPILYGPYERMPEKMRKIAVDEFGGVDEWKKHFMEVVSSEDMQKKYAKVVEWYGGKEAYKAASANPLGKDVVKGYGKRIEAVMEKLAGKKNCPTNSFEVKELVGEYGFVMKQLTQIKEESGMMKYLAWFQNTEPTKSKIDKRYGEGTAEFISQAIETFYGGGLM